MRSPLPPTPMLLSREEFREATFRRDGGRCLICKARGPLDAHHILERKLWPDGGYYLENGASLCPAHHEKAERTTLSCEQVRQAAGIGRILLPPQLSCGCVTEAPLDGPTVCQGEKGCERYDKWGNPILANGQRLRGGLFDDVGAQKNLGAAGLLSLFTHWVKGPRTFHLPWSPGRQRDDRAWGPELYSQWTGEVVVTRKMDGQAVSLYADHAHARSVTSGLTESHHWWVKKLWQQLRADIPNRWRVCGESLLAKHSIHYRHLPSFFLGYSLWNEQNWCLDWDSTTEWFSLLGVRPVAVLYCGPFDVNILQSLHQEQADGDECEGYVVRLARGFSYGAWARCTGKYVRAGHVPMHPTTPFTPNELA